MSDDYAPLEFDKAVVRPFPRAVAIVPDGSAPLPEAVSRASRARGATRLMGKALVDVGSVLGEEAVVDRPVPLAKLFALSASEHGATAGTTRVTAVVHREHAETIAHELQSIRGVRVVEWTARGPLGVWQLEVEPGRGSARRLSELLESDRVLFADKQWETRPAFHGAPKAVPIARREAAELLGRELLNRRLGGQLMRRYGGDLTALFLDLVGAMRTVRCWRIRVGDHRQTADLIQELAER